MNAQAAGQILVIGLGLASVHYWLMTISPRFRSKDDFKWWLTRIVPQAVVIAWSAKLLHLF